MDLQYKNGTQCFNCRVVGVCIKEGKILLGRLRSDDYWTPLGGKPKFGEPTESAILREYQEETGAALHTDRLLSVIENFFTLDGNRWHQYIFFYLLTDPDNSLAFFEGERALLDESSAVYRWFPLSILDTVTIKPDCIRSIIETLPDNVDHIVNID